MTFYEQLKAAWIKSQSLTQIPIKFIREPQPFLAFSQWIIDQVAPYTCAFKFQIAHFAAQAREAELLACIQYVKKNYPSKVVILDAKRGDIGTTASHYLTECFDRYQADAVTLNPYLGFDSIAPFAQRRDKGCIYICRTSNAGATDFQDLLLAGDKKETLHEYIANEVVSRWNQQNAMLVMGATEPNAINKIRQKFPDIPMLVPGIGTQGGSVDSILDAGLTAAGEGLLVSASRAIIYADNPRYVAKRLNNEINAQRMLKLESKASHYQRFLGLKYVRPWPSVRSP